ncbi:MAG: DNA polymerase I, partial [Candidatus Nealsonbacteria bacterium]|nr:DNA polymerase I [Candidatus Nealsonbacteria bacterium]
MVERDRHISRQISLPGFEPEPEPVPPPPPPKQTAPPEPASVTTVSTPPPESLQGQTVWVVDSHSLIYQVFHVMGDLSSPRGEPVGAVFGFARDVLYLLEEKKPDFLFCAFDLPGKTFRHEMYDQYKVHRKAMPEDLVPQIGLIHRVIRALGVPAVGHESYEADDVLATVARVTGELGGRCFLVTADKDCRQLITDRVKMYNIRKNQIFDRDALQADWGIRPDQVVDFQALVGDATDNVPGVPLIGPKLARELLDKYGTLDEVLAHAGEVSGKKRKENLINFRDQALLSRDLVRLDDHAPVAIDWDAGRLNGSDRAAAVELFQEFGFRRLADKLEILQGEPPELPPAIEPEYRLVDTPEAFEVFLAELRQQKRFSIDSETTNVWPRWAELVGLSFCWNDEIAWYLPLRAPQGEAHLDPQATIEALRPVLEDSTIEKVGQNLKYDAIVLRGVGVELAGVAFDTMVASYLLDAGQRNHNLNDLAKRYLHHATIKIEELIGSGKDQKRMDEVPVGRVADYAGEDALLPLRLRPILAKQLAEADLDGLLADLELPLIDVLVELEYNGIRVDVDRLAGLS